MDTVEIVVVGAGVIGLAIARALARDGREVVALDAQRDIGGEVSSRNSEVMHAGIYYPPGSLKARFCVRGRDLLEAFCAHHDVPHRLCGKLIVATHADQQPALAKLRANAAACGVQLDWLEGQEALALEPALTCVAALHSPRTGIIDAHALMLALQGEAEHHGASFAFESRVTSLAVDDDGVCIGIGGAEPAVRARLLVNCAGLHAPGLAGLMKGFPAAHVPRAHLAKGSYFTLTGRPPFRHLIYPIPEPGGLGVHLTLDQAGRARFGPDVEWVDGIDYAVDPRRGERFYTAIRAYWPGLADGGLAPAYAGIRPKISGPDEPAADFRIDGPAVHGVPGVVNLFGIESPGLTSSLAIAEHVAALVQEALP